MINKSYNLSFYNDNSHLYDDNSWHRSKGSSLDGSADNEISKPAANMNAVVSNLIFYT